ncbi:STAS domain-containing protein [Streptomyces polyrhachis]|uniref:STAS domain-containing protein n=1 Tax=Streptomyces polyrhachis TaxID=1282885 RepID=A0ABW2G826_9ACTN
MPLPQLKVYRHDRHHRTLVTLAGAIDLTSSPLVRESLARCLHCGIRSIEVDLTPVTFCDCCGLNAFIEAWQHATAAGGVLQLHYPPPMLERLIAIGGSGFLLGPPGLRRLRPRLPEEVPAPGPSPVPAAPEGVR